MIKRKQLIFSFLAVGYSLGLYFFYIKYVPLIGAFQFALLHVLFIVFIFTVINVRWGTLAFIFFFPLINSLPYFFGIFEQTPHAPTALVLFLFFFLGWLIHHILFRSEPFYRPLIFKPLVLFSLLILLSGIITFLRYSHFYPLITDYVYELKTNVLGVTAGGAIMSLIFFSLNYLTGFAFLFILLNTVESKKFIRKILIVLLISTSLSVIAGYYQHFVDISFGNTPLRTNESVINATFKNPLSFGAYLSILIPVLLALAVANKGVMRVLSSLLLILVLFILPHTGTKSGFVGMFLSLFLFLIFVLAKSVDWSRLRSLTWKKSIVFLTVSLLVIALLSSILIVSKGSQAYKRLKGQNTYGGLEETFYIRWYNQWKMAAHMIKDYPLTGVGIGAYIIELPNYARIHEGRYPKWTDSAENYFLQVGAELGILALFLSIWIFWEILRQVRRNLGPHLSDNRWRYIQIGLSCALISAFLNFLVHTYIGSYEIKYTFWLLVALAFCMGGMDKEKEKKIHYDKKEKILIALFLILFCGVNLWNVTHSLSLENRTEQFKIKQNFGLYSKEITKDGREFRWTRRYGGLTVKIQKPVLEIPLLASHPDIRKNPVKVQIFLVKDFFRQKKQLDVVILREPGWKICSYRIPEEVDQEVILLLKVSRAWNPYKELGTPDPRNLGVALGELRFKDEP